ncbi:MAG: transcription termination/antitermination protein NusA [Planctomycetota bacterium]|nr:MAG: transcription termination/antitermination protein NusA [Planctomycetota bacterium]
MIGMKGSDILRIVDALHREKGVDKEIIFMGIEAALVSAAKKKLGMEKNIVIEISRDTGEITALDGETPIGDFGDLLGRIGALTAKQIMTQKIREAERDVVYDEYSKREGQLITGTVQRYEKHNVIVSLGRTEGIIPWREQVPGESYNPGERIKCLVLEVKKLGQRVRIVLSRAHPDLLRHLFELEVPEIAERIIEIKDLARDPGHRAKVAVQSIDHKVDCVGACVGIRGSRIKNIVDELNGEKIDIVRWNDSQEVYIMNSMKPALVNAIELDYENKRAKVFVEEDQLSLAIGRRGQNVRLASKLTGWDIDLVTGTPDAYEERFQVHADGSRAPRPAAAEDAGGSSAADSGEETSADAAEATDDPAAEETPPQAEE